MSTSATLPSGNYTVDPTHSTITFAVRHNGISTFRSTFNDYDVTLTDGVLTGSARVDSVDISLEPFKAHVLGDDFFAAEQYPEIAFKADKIDVAADGSAKLSGELTIRGVSKPLEATGKFGSATGLDGTPVVALELETTVDRREFGLEWQAQLPTGGDVLDWNVTISAQLELKQQA